MEGGNGGTVPRGREEGDCGRWEEGGWKEDGSSRINGGNGGWREREGR